MSNPVVIGVVGASGRTGRFVVEALLENPHLRLGRALVSTHSSVLGQYASGSNVVYTSELDGLGDCAGVIDFSAPEVSVCVAKLCAERKIPLLVATTGHSKDGHREIESAASSIPLCFAANTSIGAAVLSLTAEFAKGLLGESFDIEVMEIHHRMKRDAPSGTAQSVVAGLADGDSTVVFGRSGTRLGANEVGVVSLRGGDIPGDHTVYFLGQGERLEFKHAVHDRRVWGRGAVVLMQKLLGRSPGLYGVRDLLLGAKVAPC